MKKIKNIMAMIGGYILFALRYVKPILIRALKFAWHYTLCFLKFIGKWIVTTLKFIWKYNETFIAFPIGLYLLYFGTVRLNKFGLSTYDLGVVQKLIIGIAFFFIIVGMARLIQRMQWPILARYNDEDTNGKWKGLSETLKYVLSVVSFLIIVLSLAILIASI